MTDKGWGWRGEKDKFDHLQCPWRGTSEDGIFYFIIHFFFLNRPFVFNRDVCTTASSGLYK